MTFACWRSGGSLHVFDMSSSRHPPVILLTCGFGVSERNPEKSALPFRDSNDLLKRCDIPGCLRSVGRYEPIVLY